VRKEVALHNLKHQQQGKDRRKKEYVRLKVRSPGQELPKKPRLKEKRADQRCQGVIKVARISPEGCRYTKGMLAKIGQTKRYLLARLKKALIVFGQNASIGGKKRCSVRPQPTKHLLPQEKQTNRQQKNAQGELKRTKEQIWAETLGKGGKKRSCSPGSHAGSRVHRGRSGPTTRGG